MEGLKPELTSFLRQAKSSSLNVTDSDDHIFSASTGLAGLASIAGGFDQVLLAAGAGGGALPSFQVNKLNYHMFYFTVFLSTTWSNLCLDLIVSPWKKWVWRENIRKNLHARKLSWVILLNDTIQLM